ncbi:hypothetical protein [Bosea sp. (in: a-proteobacteria)]|uniref:hypothetical protein n=1 Tax=Bosea sp. (in: a-proteobacteria) TaxID=1871050 RepID=UPI001AD0A964|nr:hypothetical protein [Bosea sp. (in: a-proteobacteria)]MBN9435796.1 hypothetical protein [Bosea sp. (in: a-proteobacteria)]
MRKRCTSIARGILPVTAVVLGLAVLAGDASVNATETFRALKGAEIRNLFTGMEFTDEVHWVLLFGRNGTLTNTGMGRKTQGRWQVKRDDLCLDRAPGEQRCYAVLHSGKTYRLQERGFDIYEEGIVQRPSRH